MLGGGGGGEDTSKLIGLRQPRSTMGANFKFGSEHCLRESKPSRLPCDLTRGSFGIHYEYWAQPDDD